MNKKTTPKSPTKSGGEVSPYKHQPTALDIHKRGTPLKSYVLYPGSIGLTIRDAVVDALQMIWQEKQLASEDFPLVEIEHPADMTHGDWSCNIALQLARVFRQSPLQIAEQLVGQLNKKSLDGVTQIEAVAPGFVNFYLADIWLTDKLTEITKLGDEYGTLEIRSGKSIMIEHTQPNSHKALHIGHLRNTFLGMSEVRLYRAIGYNVISTTYGGDIGPHVAKCLWGLLDRNVDLDSMQTLDERVDAIQDAYVYGTQIEMRDEKVKKEVKRINKALYEKSDSDLVELWQKTFTWSVDKQKELYARIGTKFDRYYWESEVWELGLKTVQENIGKVFEESQGAVIFPGEKYGLHTRVFITSQGTAPYEAKDLGLEQLKTQEYDFNFGVIQTGNDHIGYFQVVLKTLELIFPQFAGVFENETFGMVNLPSGKMSTRQGNTITADNIFDEMHERAYEEVDKRYPDLAEDKKHEIAEIIGLGATKYAMLKYDPKQDIAFDPEQTLSFSGDSGPYLQYVCVRIQSMLDKAKTQGLGARGQGLGTWAEQLKPSEEILMRKLYQFPEIIISSTLEYKPNFLCAYLFDLAQAYNDFYLACPVLKAETDIAAGRLELSTATLQVIKNGLALLGIAVPEKM